MKAWLFDVDGVLTNPTEKRVEEPEIINKLLKILQSGDLIGLNTGRSLEFVEREVITPLEKITSDRSLLDNLFFVGEKGGTWGMFINGQMKEYVDEKIKIPIELQNEVRTLIEKDFKETTFYDESKRTMISTEYKKGADIDAYHEEQKKLEEILKVILRKFNLTDLKVEPSIIATDIQTAKVGKDLGVERFLNMIKDKSEPEEFETFGDSPSDIEMFKYLKSKDHKAVFVYVGPKEIEEGERIIKTKEKFDKGTLEYFKTHEN